jgi:hypothetical protein
VANLFFTPLLMDVYFSNVTDTWMRALLWPINIWMLEIIEGYVLIFLYGFNPAWTYRGSDAFFHGNIKLGYWQFWLPMGAFMAWYGWESVLKPAGTLGALYMSL